MSELPFAATTPVSVSRVGLKARDAESLAAYYRKVVGLQELMRTAAIAAGITRSPLLFYCIAEALFFGMTAVSQSLFSRAERALNRGFGGR
jgi:ABC-type arginine transport system permease subunit